MKVFIQTITGYDKITLEEKYNNTLNNLDEVYTKYFEDNEVLGYAFTYKNFKLKVFTAFKPIIVKGNKILELIVLETENDEKNKKYKIFVQEDEGNLYKLLMSVFRLLEAGERIYTRNIGYLMQHIYSKKNIEFDRLNFKTQILKFLEEDLDDKTRELIGQLVETCEREEEINNIFYKLYQNLEDRNENIESISEEIKISIANILDDGDIAYGEFVFERNCN